MKSYVIAISGASGAVYGVTLLDFLLRAGYKVYLTLTHEARLIIKGEMGLDWGGNFQESAKILGEKYGDYDLVCCNEGDMASPIASGSVPTEGMVVAPCSMKALAAIAHGISSTLVERAADVTLKEKRPLILIPRETPLSRIHLGNMLLLADMGATLMPAMPAFYHRPKSIDDMVQFVVGRALDALKIKNELITRWSGK
ncbi:MAG: UbiX family flavin prenyltransferase [Nitrospiria bacterium]